MRRMCSEAGLAADLRSPNCALSAQGRLLCIHQLHLRNSHKPQSRVLMLAGIMHARPFKVPEGRSKTTLAVRPPWRLDC